MKRVLVTGPAERLADYAQAARSAGWEAIEAALLRIEPRPFASASLRAGACDWICLTSASALPFLELALASRPDLRSASLAAVGERTAERAVALGLKLGLEPAADASTLVRALLARSPQGARILWPRGNLSDDFARALREGGLEVEDPLAYTTHAVEGGEPLPPAEAVFFASPSAVRAWHERVGESQRRIAIAIGRTTFDALLQETEARFFDTISLPQPTPEALGFVLAHLDLETPP
jgi:uroporphyrinogen-III synthase